MIFVKDFSPDWQAEAAEIGRHHDFKHGINVELVTISDKMNIDVRFFERGVGETQSSGTGSCAAAVAAIAAKKAESPVRVHAPGGVQTVRWEQQVFLRGPAHWSVEVNFLSKVAAHATHSIDCAGHTASSQKRRYGWNRRAGQQYQSGFA